MKKLLVTALAVGMITLTSASVFAATTNVGATACPNGNETCVNNQTCTSSDQMVNHTQQTSSGQNNVATPITVAAEKLVAKTSDTAAFVCANGNTACINNGACTRDRPCQYPAGCPKNGVSTQDGTGFQNGGQGRGQHNGCHGGNRNR